MNVDCAFFTGKSHNVCQDYAISGIKNEQAYAIISDGCSGSPDTDFGARLLPRAAMKALDNFEPNTEEFFLHVVSIAEIQATALGLNPMSVDATLLILTAKENQISGGLYGDGLLAIKYRGDQLIQIVSLECSSLDGKEFPSYPNYLLGAERIKSWDNLNPHGISMDRYFIDCESMKRVEIHEQSREEYKILNTVNRGRWIDVYGKSEEIEWIAVISDGAKTFVERPVDSQDRRIEVVEALSCMLDFKGIKGEFIKRQTNWFMRTKAKQPWFHDDDLSIAAISMEE